jgi:hypothetical protein
MTLDAQAYRVSAGGRFMKYLPELGLNAHDDLLELKGTLAHQPSGLSVGLAFNHFGGLIQRPVSR